MSDWFVYIIEATDTRLYTGITTDVPRRWAEHSAQEKGNTKGAKFFRGRQPKQLRFIKLVDNRSEASKLEWAIKKSSRKVKLQLIEGSTNEFSHYQFEVTQHD